MQNSDPLVWYGTGLIVLLSAIILVPYVRGRSDLATPWNIFLVGVIMFSGIGCLEVRYGDLAWPQLQWFQPTEYEVTWYMLATTTFVVVVMLGYYYNPLASSMALRGFRAWPSESVPMMVFVVVLCLVLVFIASLTSGVFIVGAVLFQVSSKAIIFATVFSFLLWYRNRLNAMWLALFLIVFVWAGLYAMLISAGRRVLLSVLLGPVLCVYWTHVRYWRPTRCVSVLALAAFVIFFVGVGYSSFRWYSRGHFAEERSFQTLVGQIQEVRERPFAEVFFSNKLHYIAQSSAHYALLTERFVNNGQLDSKPLNTLRFLLAYPIPRSIWSQKPEMIGIVLFRDVIRYRYTNCGVGIAGHGAYEGGILALALYALLIAWGLRVISDPMGRQPENPFLLGALAAAGPQILSIPRGDFGGMIVLAVTSYLFACALSMLCRLLFGTQMQSQNPHWSHVVPRQAHAHDQSWGHN